MQKITLLFLTLLSFHTTFSQSVNQTNAEGKKIGLWEVKLNTELKPIVGSDYSYIVYNRYDDKGDVIYLYERDINKLFKTKDSIYTILDSVKDSILLTGEVRVYNYIEETESENLIRVEKYKNGHPIYIENRTYSEDEEIESSYTFDFLCPCIELDKGFSYQTTRNGKEYCFYKGSYGWDSYPVDIINSTPVTYKYPYFDHTPPLIGLVGGYNFIRNNQIEVGLMFNLIESELRSGAMAGYLLSYSRPLDRNLNTIGLEMGLYSPVTLGMGLNSNFDDQKNHILGFKVFGGVTFYHTQLIYEYNMFRNKNNTVLDLNHHALKVRATVPLFRIWK